MCWVLGHFIYKMCGGIFAILPEIIFWNEDVAPSDYPSKFQGYIKNCRSNKIVKIGGHLAAQALDIGSVAVVGVFWPASEPVSGTVSDTNEVSVLNDEVARQSVTCSARDALFYASRSDCASPPGGTRVSLGGTWIGALLRSVCGNCVGIVDYGWSHIAGGKSNGIVLLRQHVDWRW